MEPLTRNVRYAFRTLTRAPLFTATVVVTFALGIGAATAIFSVIDTVLLRPLPFPDADRLVYFSHVQGDTGVDVAIPPIRLLDWRERSSTLEAIATHYTEDVTDTTGDRPESVRKATVMPGFLELWRIPPAAGRGFTDEEYRFGGPPAALVSHRYWREQMGTDPNAVGRTVRIDDVSYPVIGILPAEFASVDRKVDVWLPHSVGAPWAGSRTGGWFAGVVARLEPGVGMNEARADLAAVQAQLGGTYPETDRGLTLRAVPFKSTVVGALGGSLWLLFGAVVLLLLIACTNIAALLFARIVRRERDVAIRRSLGASRGTVVAQLFTEALVLALIGAAAGVLVAYGAVAAMKTFATDVPRFTEFAVGPRVLLYVGIAGAVVALLCGLAPALKSTRGNDSATKWSRGVVASRNTLNWALVGVQVTLSVTLLAGAGLLLRSYDELARVDPGFDAEHVLTFRVSGSFNETRDYPALVQRITRTLEDLEALPGVESAATSWAVPGVLGRQQEELQLVEVRSDFGGPLIAETRVVSPSYFATLQIPVLAGARCGQTPSGATEAMVNRSFAQRYFPSRSIVGLHLAGNTPDRITGIVGDAREVGTDQEPVPTVYRCFNASTPFPWFLVRTTGDPGAATQAVRARINQLEPLRSVYDIQPLDERIGGVYAQNRLRTFLVTLFAAAALALCCLGIYGTLSYVASLRRREVGLRLAVGAVRSAIVAQFVVKALRVVGAACLIGFVLSLALTYALSGMLYGVSPFDPATWAGVLILVTGVAAAAALLPAIRAARIDPMEALREE